MIGKLIFDYALGRSGIVVDGPNVEVGDGTSSLAASEIIVWEWLVLYDNGETAGADTNEIKEIGVEHVNHN